MVLCYVEREQLGRRYNNDKPASLEEICKIKESERLRLPISLCWSVPHREAQRMTKLNWSCTSCGMSSPRRFSVQRHVDNYNIHNGLGQVVPFLEYSVGRREGKYQPQKVPQFTRSKAPFLDNLLDKIEAEVENQIVKDIAKRVYDRLSTDQTPFDNLAALATANIINKNFYRILKESIS